MSTEVEQAEVSGNGNGVAHISDLDSKIIKQIEYYFGDLNFPRDKFLQEEVKKDNGWVALDTMVKFNRLRELSADSAVIAAALKKSTSGLMEVNEDGTKIRRSTDRELKPFSKEVQVDLRLRTAYAKGFPLDATLDQLMEFCEKFGKTEQVSLRKTKERTFKGSIFVVFQSAADAKKFVEAEEVKYGDNNLIRYSKDGYWKMKAEERSGHKAENNVKTEGEKQQMEAEAEKRLLDKITRGALLHMDNVPMQTTVEDVRKVFEGIKVMWVDREKDSTEAIVRFEAFNGAQAALTAKSVDGKLTVNGQEVVTRILEGDEEVAYWKKLWQAQRDKKDRLYGKGGRGRGRGRGKGRGGRGGRGGRRQNKKDRKDGDKAANDEGDDGDDGAGDDDGDDDFDGAGGSPSSVDDDDGGPAEKKVRLE